MATVCVLLLPASSALARPGDRDPTFGTGGVSVVGFTNPLATHSNAAVGLSPMRVQPNGDLILAGVADFSYSCDELGCDSAGPAMVATRLDSNGTIDPTYGDDGTISKYFGTLDYEPYEDEVVTVDPQGRVVFVYYPAYNQPIQVTRFTAQGALDTSFSGDGTADVFPANSDSGYLQVATQSDGSIIVAARAPGNGSDIYSESLKLARLAPDGSIDPSFPAGGQPLDLTSKHEATPGRLVVDSADRILVSQRHYEQSSNTLPYLVYRFHPDGSPDETFGTDGAAGIQSDNFVVDDASRIYAFGEGGVSKLLPDGDPDTSFASGGSVAVPGDVYANPIAPDGHGGVFAAAASFGNLSGFKLVHLLSDGLFDPGFGIQGRSLTFLDSPPSSAGLLVDPSGRPVVASGSSQLRGVITRFRVDGDPPDDLDADGSDDSNDACPARYGPADDGCPSYDVSLAMKRGSTFRRGRVLMKAVLASERGRCTHDVSLDLFRKRKGPDQRMDQVKLRGLPWSNAIAYSFSVKRGPERYYAAFAGTFDPTFGRCPAVRSPVIRAQGSPGASQR